MAVYGAADPSLDATRLRRESAHVNLANGLRRQPNSASNLRIRKAGLTKQRSDAARLQVPAGFQMSDPGFSFWPRRNLAPAESAGPEAMVQAAAVGEWVEAQGKLANRLWHQAGLRGNFVIGHTGLAKQRTNAGRLSVPGGFHMPPFRLAYSAKRHFRSASLAKPPELHRTNSTPGLTESVREWIELSGQVVLLFRCCTVDRRERPNSGVSGTVLGKEMGNDFWSWFFLKNRNNFSPCVGIA